MVKQIQFSLILAGILLLNSCQQTPPPLPSPGIKIIAQDLLNPIGMALLPDGSLLIAEDGTGEGDMSAGISQLKPNGTLKRIISGFPSSRDSGDLSGSPFVALSPDGKTIYTSHFNLGHLLTLNVADIPQVGNPLQPSSPLLQPAMQPLNNVQIINPFDLTFDVDGRPVVTDASGNGVAKETAAGTTRFIHRFADLENPTNTARPIDPVPTGITRVGTEYFVTLTGGCPFPAGGGQLAAIDENRKQRLIAGNLNMPIDITQGADGTLWLLEFAAFTPDGNCFSGTGYQPHTGRLSRLNEDDSFEVAVEHLNFPGAVLSKPDGTLLISEIFSGRILAINLGDDLPLDVAAILEEPVAAVTPPPPQPTSQPAPTPSPTPAPWHFQNVAAQVGLDFTHGAFQTSLSPDPAAMMGGGLCWLDYNNDGWLDLYLVNSHAKAEETYWAENGGLPRNALFENNAGIFTNITTSTYTDLALRGNGCVAADFNLDGWTDIYITAEGPNALLWNNGDGTFGEGAENAGIAALEWNTAAVVGDLNHDGWPDLFTTSYIDPENKIPKPVGAFPQDFYGLGDHFYLNQGLNAAGRATFLDVTAAVGLEREERGLGALLTDVDNDGDLDLYLANDGHPNRLYENQPAANAIGFRFVDLSATAAVGDSGSGMGIAGGDYDNDGQLDLLVTNWDTELNALYRNQTAAQGSINFRYSTNKIGIAGLGNNKTAWGTAWADLDHDSDLDLIIAHGHVPITDFANDAQLVRLYGNRLAEGYASQFREWTQIVGLREVGPLLARGSALADFDNDGDLDMAINSIGGAVTLLRNENPPGNWLQFAFDGFYPGTKVWLTLADGQKLMREWNTGSSYLASEDPRLHFGLGDTAVVSKIIVNWLDGSEQVLSEMPANQIIYITKP